MQDRHNEDFLLARTNNAELELRIPESCWDESEVDFLTKALESKVTKEVTISYNGDGHESLDYVDKDGWQHNIWGDKFKATTDSP